MKSGPTLKACTASPRRRSASNSPSVTVVFPTPLETPAMTRTGTISEAFIVRADTPANLVFASKPGPQADEEVGPERRKAAHLGIRLVEDVLGPRDQLEALQPAKLVEQAVRAARVHARVAAVVQVAVTVELIAHRVHLDEDGETAKWLPGEAGAAAVARDARQRPPGAEIVGVGVRVGEGGDE